MNAVELVKQTCKERGISIAKLERDCDFGNGYIGKTKRETFPVDKAKKISEYLGIDLNLLIGVQPDVQSDGYYVDKDTADIAQELSTTPGMRVLFDAAKDSKPEDLEMAADLLRRLKQTNPDE